MKIIERAASFEVQSDDGSIVRQFPFDTKVYAGLIPFDGCWNRRQNPSQKS